MNTALESFAHSMDLTAASNERLRLAFGYACVQRVEHLLEEPQVIECLQVLGRFLEGSVDATRLKQAQEEALQLANRHRGSNSLDGCGHAAVSASYAVAQAVNGKALQAASYAAYAVVYAGGGYGAVSQREAYEGEFNWQLNSLKSLAAAHASPSMVSTA